MESRVRVDWFCVIVFVLGTFQEERRETQTGGGNAASARAPGRMDPHKAADVCQLVSTPSHQMTRVFGLEKESIPNLIDALWMGFTEPPQANELLMESQFLC